MIDLLLYKRRGVWRVARLQPSKYASISIRHHYWWDPSASDHYWWVRLLRLNLPEDWQPLALAVAANFAFLKPRCLLVGWIIGGERGVEQFEALLADHFNCLQELEKVGITAAVHVRRRHFIDCCRLSLSTCLDALDQTLRPRDG